jgi:hypothetical protein
MKTKLLVFGSVSMCVLALSLTSAARDDRQGDQDSRSRGHDEKQSVEDKRIQKGFDIAPVALDFKGKNIDRVGLGSYLVNATGGCNDCHTNPAYVFGSDPFAGQPKQVNAKRYLAGGAAFGPFTSRNITPEDNGLPAGLTFDKFLEVIRHGTDFDNLHPAMGPLLQVMPWPVYQNLKTSDVRAIYEYLKAIPHAEPCAPPGPGPGETDLSCKTAF